MRKLHGFILFAPAIALAGTSIWSLQQSPTSEVFNGFSAPHRDFVIGVGENGAIVHFVNGDGGTLIASGTNNELFDVYASSNALAVATGVDVVLIWDGAKWSPIASGNSGTNYTGTWISPEADVVLYGSLGTTFSFVCPYFPGSTDPPPFCRTFVSPMLTACGNSGDIRVITSAGDIFRVNNFLADIEGFDPIHDEAVPLGLTAVWAPAWACVPGHIEPLELFAIRNGNEFWRFNGADWNNMNVTVPAGQTLTWLAGTGSGNIVAVGFKSGMSGNEGVVWTFDGTKWSEDTDLPAGTPGLTDVVANLEFSFQIFNSGFETPAMAKNVSGAKIDILAAAEQGRYLSTGVLFPQALTDLRISKRLLTEEPINLGETITFEFVLQNLGPGDAMNFRFLDGYLNNIMILTDTCGMSQFNNQAGWHYRDVRVPLLAAGGVITCTMEFQVVGPVGESIRNYAAVAEADEHNYRNNRSDVRDVIIQP